MHLPTGVVEVVLAHHLVTAGFEQSRNRIAEHRVAPVADRERPGRIGADELDLHLQAAARRAAAEAAPLGANLRQPLPPEARRELEVQETRPRDRDGGEVFALRQAASERLGDLPRRPSLGAREHQRQVGSQVSVSRILRNVDSKRGEIRCLQLSPLFGLSKGFAQERMDEFLHLPPGGPVPRHHDVESMIVFMERRSYNDWRKTSQRRDRLRGSAASRRPVRGRVIGARLDACSVLRSSAYIQYASSLRPCAHADPHPADAPAPSPSQLLGWQLRFARRLGDSYPPSSPPLLDPYCACRGPRNPPPVTKVSRSEKILS